MALASNRPAALAGRARAGSRRANQGWRLDRPLPSGPVLLLVASCSMGIYCGFMSAHETREVRATRRIRAILF